MTAYNLEDLVKGAPNASARDALNALAAKDPAIWSMLHRRLRGAPLTYNAEKAIQAAHDEGIVTGKDYLNLLMKHRPFLIEPLCDEHPHKVYKKSRQMGVSELSVTEALHLCDRQKMNWIYTFPRDTQLRDFSNTRIRTVKQESVYMANLFGEIDQIYLKMIGKYRSYIFFRSAWDENLGEGIDADAVTFDEKDRMFEGVDAAFTQSLRASPYGLIREVSTPTIPNKGVDASYQKSDQRVWLVKCTKCGDRQEVKYPDNVIQMKDIPPSPVEYEPGTFEFRCRKEGCRGKLDRLRGEWVALRPSIKGVRGYHMPQTIAPWISATGLMADRLNSRLKQHWERYCLALTSMGESTQLIDTHFVRCVSGHEPVFSRARRDDPWEYITCGIDWGKENWVVFRGHNKFNSLDYIINMFQIDEINGDPLEVAKAAAGLIDMLRPDLIVADAGYGRAQNAHLYKAFGRRFWSCQYKTEARAGRSFKVSWGSTTAEVRADRTTELKTTMQEIRDRQIGLPAHQDLPTFTSHHKNLVPTIEENKEGQLIEIIDKKGPDHYAHASTYARIAMEKLTRVGLSSGHLSIIG